MRQVLSDSGQKLLKGTGLLYATGRDTRIRKQYVYHPNGETLRDEKKFDALRMFAEVLPRIRSRVTRDLARDHLDRRRVLALTVRIMDQTLIRVGNTMYAKSNNSSVARTSPQNFSAPGIGKKEADRFMANALLWVEKFR